jgi:hypothetical protein
MMFFWVLCATYTRRQTLLGLFSTSGFSSAAVRSAAKAAHRKEALDRRRGFRRRENIKPYMNAGVKPWRRLHKSVKIKIYKTIILSVVLFGCDTLPVIQREDSV